MEDNRIIDPRLEEAAQTINDLSTACLLLSYGHDTHGVVMSEKKFNGRSFVHSLLRDAMIDDEDFAQEIILAAYTYVIDYVEKNGTFPAVKLNKF